MLASLFEELSRLLHRYNDFCRSRTCCPRDRTILKTKLQDLEDLAEEASHEQAFLRNLTVAYLEAKREEDNPEGVQQE